MHGRSMGARPDRRIVKYWPLVVNGDSEVPPLRTRALDREQDTSPYASHPGARSIRTRALDSELADPGDSTIEQLDSSSPSPCRIDR
jgi:hypothetical protein